MTTRAQQISLGQLLLLMLLAAILTMWIVTARRYLKRNSPMISRPEVALSPDGERFYSLGARSAAVFDTRTGRQLASTSIADDLFPVNRFRYLPEFDVVVAADTSSVSGVKFPNGCGLPTVEIIGGAKTVLHPRTLQSLALPAPNPLMSPLPDGDVIAIGLLGDSESSAVAPILRRRNLVENQTVYEEKIDKLRAVSHLMLCGKYVAILGWPRNTDEFPANTGVIEIRDQATGKMQHRMALQNRLFVLLLNPLANPSPTATRITVAPSGRCAALQIDNTVFVMEGTESRLVELSNNDSGVSTDDVCIDDQRNLFVRQQTQQRGLMRVAHIHPLTEKLTVIARFQNGFATGYSNNSKLAMTDGKTLLVGSDACSLTKFDTSSLKITARFENLRVHDLRQEWRNVVIVSLVWGVLWVAMHWGLRRKKKLAAEPSVTLSPNYGPHLILFMAVAIALPCAFAGELLGLTGPGWKFCFPFLNLAAIALAITAVMTERSNRLLGSFVVVGSIVALFTYPL